MHVVLHLLNFANETHEVSCHSCKEVNKRAVNFLHLLLDSYYSLLELLAKRLGSCFDTCGSHKKLLR